MVIDYQQIATNEFAAISYHYRSIHGPYLDCSSIHFKEAIWSYVIDHSDNTLISRSIATIICW